VSTTSLLELQGLSKSFGAVQVTQAISLDISEGEALGVIGPNGAGKSTLFSLIAGTLAPSAGSIRFEGMEIAGRSAAWRCRRGIARSFQVPQPFVDLTVYENVLTGALFGARLPWREAEQRAVEVLRVTALAGKARALASSLTLLDRKRLELARALVTAPKLLLLDEIAGGLTDHECAELIDIIRGIRTRGVTIVWIEHIVHALLAVVDRLLVLDTGKLIAQGEPHVVIASPQVVALYMGMPDD